MPFVLLICLHSPRHVCLALVPRKQQPSMLDGASNLIVLYAEKCMIYQRPYSENNRISLYNNECRKLIEIE